MDFINAEAAFECQTCHGTVFKLPDVPADDSIAKCKTCGAQFGRWGDLKEMAAEAAVKTALGEAIKGTGFKFKLTLSRLATDRPPHRRNDRLAGRAADDEAFRVLGD